MSFVRAGHKPPSHEKELTNKLEKQLRFPDILMTNLNLDIVIFSNQRKTVMLLKLIISWKENIEAAHERKIEKYKELVGECRERSWQATCEPIEVAILFGMMGAAIFFFNISDW